MSEDYYTKTARRLYELLTEHDDKDEKKSSIERLCGIDKTKYTLIETEPGILKISVDISKKHEIITHEELSFPYLSLEYEEIITTLTRLIQKAINIHDNKK